MVGLPPAVHVMLVDDHPVVRRGVRDILVEALPHAVVQEVASGSEATSLVGTREWDLVILDLMLPDASGFDVLRHIREKQTTLPVLVLSMHAAEQFARRAISAGASGYLAKDAADAELVTAVGRVIRGGKYFGPDAAEQSATTTHPEHEEQPHERLSNREYEVLRMIGAGKTVSEIATALGLSVKTVSTYRARVLEKMNMRTNAALTRYALRHGLVE